MDPTSDDEKFISKSQRKRDMLKLQDMGEQLTKLSASQLQKLTLPEELRDAVLAAQQINSRGAHKRQLQYIGRLMRDIDPQPIQQQLDDLLLQSAAATRHFHQLEQWRERLLDDGDHAVTDLVQAHPETDIQHLRQLIRAAQKEKLGNKTPRAARAIFQYLRELMEND
jgi:ribosome-associated protein